MKNWSKFYTPKPVAKEIIDRLPKTLNPSKVIDICAGSGNFLEAAIKQWKNIKAIGVDISLSDINQQNKYILHQFDALNLELLSTKIITDNKELKLVLANPPFGKLENSEEYLVDSNTEYNSIRKEAIKTKRIEALMLYSNLQILNKGDHFGAILPENFFTSSKLFRFKEMFINEFTDVTIGDKEKYFNNSEVKTRIFIGKYVGNNNKICEQKNQPKLFNEPNYQLHRGIDNSKLLSTDEEKNVEVLHFSNLEGIQKLKRFFPKTKQLERLIVSKNDTLILRVGRNSGYSYQAKNEFINKSVSDYFYLLKGIKFSKKEHTTLQRLLIKKRKGITTYYLSKTDIINSIDIILNERKAS